MNTTICQACERPCDLYLCTQCAETLRGALIDLPWWLARLAEAAVGQVRLGDGGRRQTRCEPFHGDDPIDIPIVPDSTLLRRFLAAGRVNARAADTHTDIVNTLSAEIYQLCITHHINPPHLQTPAHMALWLAGSVSAIQTVETAGDTYDALYGLPGLIERIINRPEPPRMLGPCPGTKDDHRCNELLTARRRAIEITCRNCRTTHNVERVETELLGELDHYRFSQSELLRALEARGEPVPKQTLSDWIRTGKLARQGFRRPIQGDRARIGSHRHSDDDVPVYRLADARRLRAEQPKRKARA